MRTKVLPLLIAAGAIALLAGCSSTGTTASVLADGGVSDGVVVDGAATQPVPALGAPEADAVAQDRAVGGAATTVNVPTDRQIVKNANVTMRVDDVTKTVFTVHALIAKRNGLISSEDTQANGDSTNSLITAQIPAPSLDAFIADVTKLGTVDSVTVGAQDVTGQVVDLDARIAALRTSVDRMTQLLAQAQKIDDMLAIETQLSARQAELDSLTAQRKALGDQVALSAVTIALSPKTTVSTVDAPGFLSGLASGWAAVVSLATVIVTATGFLLPFGIIALVIIVPLAIIAVRQSRRRRENSRRAPAESTPTSVDDERAPTYTTT